MSKNSESTNISPRGSTVTTTHTVESRGVTHTVTQSKYKRSISEKVGIGLNVFALIVGVLLVVSLVKSLTGSNPITFGGLLDTLAAAPSVDMTMTTFETIAPLQWGGILSGLAGFLNIFITIFNVLIFAFKGLYQVAVYLWFFIKFIFV